MADTRPNIVIPANTWVDIYAELNAQAGFPPVAVGEQIRVQLIGDARVHLTVSATQPAALDRYSLLSNKAVPFINNTGDSGAWAYSYGRSEVVVGVV